MPIAEIEQQPVAIELAGEKIVLFRNAHGEIGALLDRCPHRGAALSLGRVDENGCLECPYHGWTFDRDGACTHVPLNKPTEIKLAKLQVVSLPTRVIAGLVWVFTGQGEAPEPQLPDSLMRSTESYFIYHEVWNTHWTRVIENLMDYAHVPYVHRTSFGGEIVKNATPGGSFIEFQITQTDRHLLAPYALEVAKGFLPPVVEDRIMIESQPGPIPTTGECHVPSDRATLLFLRWYHQTIVS